MGIEGGSRNGEVQNQEIQQSINEQNELNQAEHQRNGEELEANSTIDNEGKREQIDGKDDEEFLDDESKELDKEDSIEDENQNNPEETQGEFLEQNQDALDTNDIIEDSSDETDVQEDNESRDEDFLDENDSIEDESENENLENDSEDENLESGDELEQIDSLESDDSIENENGKLENNNESRDDDSLYENDSMEDELENDILNNKTEGHNPEEQKPVAIENSPLSSETVEQIRGIEKGERPDPSTYMSQEMINENLDKFKDGGSFVMTQDQYDMYVDGNDTIGCPDNSQYMTTKENMDDIFAKSNGNIGVIEDSLGFDRGHFEGGGGIVRIDVDKPLELNGRIPSGNEMGANDRWIPGGQTDGPNGGSPEIVTDKIPNDDTHRHITFGL